MPVQISARTRILCGLGLAVATVGVGGCRQPDISRHDVFRPDRVALVEWSGPDLPEREPVALDVRNQRGSVWIEVDENLTEPEVRGVVSWSRGREARAWPRGDDSGLVSVTREVSGNGAVVSVAGSLHEGAPASAFLDLRIRTPRCDGVRVINDGGPIVLVGVDGAITAQNGVQSGDGGRIELRTSRPVRDPVALVTTEGRISAVIDPESEGVIELDTEEGRAQFETEYGMLKEVRPGPSSFRAVWNGGDNPIIARSGRGTVHVQVKPNAEMYSVADDWMALFGD